MLVREDREAYWLSFCGDAGLGNGVGPGLGVVNRGEVMRELLDTVELAFGGGRCRDGEVWISGVPLAWKNFGCVRSSEKFDPTADPDELRGFPEGTESPLA